MRTNPWIFLVGRVLFGGYFLLSGINHFTHLQQLAAYSTSKGVPAPQLGVLVGGVLLFLGGLSVLLGVRPRIGLLLIAIFLIPVTFLIHNFWADTDPAMRMNDQVSFLKNIG